MLTGEAFAYAAREHAAGRPLAHNERLLLLFMAHTALDADRPPRYFGSRERSAVALGRMVPDEPSLDMADRDRLMRERQNAFSLIKTATRGLVERGAIERVRSGRAGQRAEFVLRFPGAVHLVASSVPLGRSANVTPWGASSAPHRGVPAIPPRKKTGTKDDEGGRVVSGSASRAA